MANIHITWRNLFAYKSLIIDWHDFCGPIFLRHKDLEPKDMARISGRQWGEFMQWHSLSDEEKERYRLVL